MTYRHLYNPAYVSISNNSNRGFLCLILFLFLVVLGAITGTDAYAGNDIGRKIVTMQCNDCHTAGWPESAGDVPETEWLKGNPVGWKGPWGVTYSINLRIYFSDIAEKEWVEAARSMRPRPLMPWWAFRSLTDDELVSMYRFIKNLPGDLGKEAPDFIEPGKKVNPPYYDLILPPQPQK